MNEFLLFIYNFYLIIEMYCVVCPEKFNNIYARTENNLYLRFILSRKFSYY